jgi:hypothetical protein
MSTEGPARAIRFRIRARLDAAARAVVVGLDRSGLRTYARLPSRLASSVRPGGRGLSGGSSDEPDAYGATIIYDRAGYNRKEAAPCAPAFS